MSAENKARLSEVSHLQRELNGIALVEDLETKGIHAHSLLRESETLDAPLLERIDRAMHEEKEIPAKPTFAQRNRIFARRRSRRIASRLLDRR